MILKAGVQLPSQVWIDMNGEDVPLAQPGFWTHVQFRRFAGCPMCNLHLQAFLRGYARLQSAGLREIVVFHSSAADLKRQHAEALFPIIPDPTRSKYRAFGVERSPYAILNPRAMAAMLKGVLRHGIRMPARGESLMGLPADFLIDGEGRLQAVHYGKHGDDQWSFEQVLKSVSLAASAST